MTLKIKSCPMPKHDPKAIRYSWPDGRAPAYWRVVCSCGARGPHGVTRKDAIDVWNKYVEERGT